MRMFYFFVVVVFWYSLLDITHLMVFLMNMWAPFSSNWPFLKTHSIKRTSACGADSLLGLARLCWAQAASDFESNVIFNF